MKKFPLIVIAVAVLIIVGGVFLIARRDNSKGSLPLPANLEYYWGDGCPHCTNVANFMAAWPGKDTVKIDKFEVWKNPRNAAGLQKRYESCGVPQSEMGVPLLFTPEGKCYSGDTPIIDYLKTL